MECVWKWPKEKRIFWKKKKWIGLGVIIIVAIVKRWNLEFHPLEIVVEGVWVVLRLMMMIMMMMMMMMISNE